MQEHLDSLVYPVHYVRPEYTMYCKGLVVLTLEAINVVSQCRHCSGEGTFYSKVIHVQPHKFSVAVAELLGCGNQVGALIQELACFVIGESVLAHGEQYLDPH